MLRPRPWRLAAAGLLAACSVSVQAHNFHMGLTDISYNDGTGSTEVVHTYTAHDVAILLLNLYQRNIDLGQPEAEAALQRYVEQQFYLTGPDRRRLPLRWVGLKVDADSVLIFQEIEQTRLAPATRLHDGVLIDFQPSQSNTVNLQAGRGAPVQTLHFDATHLEQTLP